MKNSENTKQAIEKAFAHLHSLSDDDFKKEIESHVELCVGFETYAKDLECRLEEELSLREIFDKEKGYDKKKCNCADHETACDRDSEYIRWLEIGYKYYLDLADVSVKKTESIENDKDGSILWCDFYKKECCRDLCSRSRDWKLCKDKEKVNYFADIDSNKEEKDTEPRHKPWRNEFREWKANHSNDSDYDIIVTEKLIELLDSLEGKFVNLKYKNPLDKVEHRPDCACIINSRHDCNCQDTKCNHKFDKDGEYCIKCGILWDNVE
jgi:hypothetical protein